jgi:Ca2+-binding RTX toxin-like protein
VSSFVFGGPGLDKLVGSHFGEYQDGGDGDDDIVGNRGPDVLRGGNGDDKIDAFGGASDNIDCGAGNDTLLAGPSDIYRFGCERQLGG